MQRLRFLAATAGSMAEDAFPRPGVWTCVARPAAEGLDESFSRGIFGGSWSAPLTFDVRSDPRRKGGRVDRPRAARPRRPSFSIGRFAFGGTRFLRPSSDPAPMYPVAKRRSFGFARGFARCPGYSPPS